MPAPLEQLQSYRPRINFELKSSYRPVNLSALNANDTSAVCVLMQMSNKQSAIPEAILRQIREDYIEAAIISVNTQLHHACTPGQ